MHWLFLLRQEQAQQALRPSPSTTLCPIRRDLTPSRPAVTVAACILQASWTRDQLSIAPPARTHMNHMTQTLPRPAGKSVEAVLANALDQLLHGVGRRYPWYWQGRPCRPTKPAQLAVYTIGRRWGH